jgi:hypothetical protein
MKKKSGYLSEDTNEKPRQNDGRVLSFSDVLADTFLQRGPLEECIRKRATSIRASVLFLLFHQS